MYQSHWGLHETPFRNRLDPRFFYQSPTHEEALARLHFLVDQQRRLGVLLGSQGSGKSLLLEVFAEEVRRAGQPVANVNLLGVPPAEFLWLLAAELGMNPDRGLPLSVVWRLVTDRICEHRYQQIGTVVLLDDADQAEESVIAQIARLVQFDPSPESRLTIVLAGRQERIARLGETLLERVELRIDVVPWEQADTENYLKASLAQAGRQSPLFAGPAIARLHELGHGVPRRISQLADLALLAGAGQNLERIDADTVESVYHELGVIKV